VSTEKTAPSVSDGADASDGTDGPGSGQPVQARGDRPPDGPPDGGGSGRTPSPLRVPEFSQTEVDGVTTVVAPTTGPMRAGLVFRVGRADETLPIAGVTHLVEHLALHRHGLTDYHYNGTTRSVFTHFHIQGSAEDVVSFLSGVCAGLTDVPVDRLETEKQILRTEEAGRTRAVNESVPMWRHGARDYGLVSYPEWGLSRLTEDDVWQWIATWFTRDNAVLWVAGELPGGLRLPLPPGARRTVPAPSSALPVTPAYFTGNRDAVVLDALVDRGAAGSVYAGVLERELYRALRLDWGFSYTTGASYDVVGDQVAAITALADALPDKSGAALGGFIDVLMKLKVGRIDPGDIEAVRAKAAEALRHPDIAAARLPTLAVNLLTGLANLTVDELRAELNAVTVADVQRAAQQATTTALLMVPRGHTADWAGFAAAPMYSDAAVAGTRYRSLEHDDVSLVVGADGVSIVTTGGPATVRFDECAALLAWPDGARRLVGYDGITIAVEPTLYTIDAHGVAAIDAGVPATNLLWQPARDAEAIPTPSIPAADRVDGRQTTGPARGRAQGRRPVGTLVGTTSKGVLERTIMVALFTVAGFAAVLAAFVTVDVARDPAAVAADWTAAGFVWLVATMFGGAAVIIYRQRRRPR
jgi:zinc protease